MVARESKWGVEQGLRLLAWGVVALAGLIAASQAVGWGGLRSVAIVQSLTPFLGLLLVPVTGVALWRGDRLLAAIGTTIGLGLLVLSAPLAFPGGQPDPVEGATGLSIASVNLLDRNDRMVEVAERLQEVGPDLIVLSEYTAAHQAALLRSPLADDYLHRIDQSGHRGSGIAVWSRFPVVVGEHPDTMNFSLDLTVAGPDAPVRILAIHAPSPIVSVDGWRNDLATAAAFGREADTPAVVVGDLNASYWHPPFRELLDAGLTDAHSATGNGFSTSWPTNRLIPAFVRLDHALFTDDLVATDLTDFGIPGSDHRGFVVTVAPAR